MVNWNPFYKACPNNMSSEILKLYQIDYQIRSEDCLKDAEDYEREALEELAMSNGGGWPEEDPELLSGAKEAHKMRHEHLILKRDNALNRAIEYEEKARHPKL